MKKHLHTALPGANAKSKFYFVNFDPIGTSGAKDLGTHRHQLH